MRNLFILMILGAVAGSAAADSLFTPAAAKAGSLVTEKVARFEVGDIITVLVQEKIQANTSSNLNTKKESDVDSQAAAGDNQFLVADSPGGLNIMPQERLPNWGIGMKNEQKTTGNTTRTSTLTTTITCTVSKVFPNGNVEIEGQKRVTVNREDSTIVVRGLVRAEDISVRNTVASTQLANAEVELKGKGPLWNNQRRGWLTRVLDWFQPY